MRLQHISSQFMVNIIVGTLLLFFCMLSSMPISGILSILTFGAYFVYIIASHPVALFKYLAFIFAIVANILGVFSIEYSSVYLFELVTYSSFEGSLPLLIFSRWVFLALLVWLDIKWSSSKEDNIKTLSKRGVIWLNIGATAVLVAMTALLIVTIQTPPAFSVGLDRFAYASYAGSNLITSLLSGSMTYLMFLPVQAIRRGNQKIGIIAVVFYCIYLLWVGTKFGGFLNLVCIFFLVYYDYFECLNIHTIRKITIVALAIIIALVGVSGIVYSTTSSTSATSGLSDYLSSRTSQQGQLWWAQYSISNGETHPEEFVTEIEGALHGSSSIAENQDSKYGIYGEMYRVAPSNLVSAKLASGSRYTESGYAVAYYYFGAIGAIIFSLIMGFLAALILASLVEALRGLRLVEVLVLARLFFLLQTTLSMFTFNDLLDPLSIASYIFLLISWVIRKRESLIKRKSFAGYLAKQSLFEHDLRR